MSGARGHGGGALSLVSLVMGESRRRRGVQRLTSDIRGRRQWEGSSAAGAVQDDGDSSGTDWAGEVGMRRASMCSVSGMR